jgi:hypothetical protein
MMRAKTTREDVAYACDQELKGTIGVAVDVKTWRRALDDERGFWASAPARRHYLCKSSPLLPPARTGQEFHEVDEQVPAMNLCAATDPVPFGDPRYAAQKEVDASRRRFWRLADGGVHDASDSLHRCGLHLGL